MIIAVDAVGGDHYPESPVEGALQAMQERPDLEIILAGPRGLIENELSDHEYDSDRLCIRHAPEIIEMNESPASAVKTKQNSSIVTSLKLHKANECDAFVSTGNTGVLLAASTLILGKLKGVSRPAIAAVYPTIKGPRLLIDAGANLEMRTKMYVQFARMGCIFERRVMDIDDPRIALLNIGEEGKKGTQGLRSAYKALSKVANFVGNAEGNDILFGKADVYVCDGLVGNLVLKLGESFPNALQEFIKRGAQKIDLAPEKMQLVAKVLKASLAEFNPESIGGVPFLGVAGVSMVGHGGSTAIAVKNMIMNAVKYVENNINDEIIATLNE